MCEHPAFAAQLNVHRVEGSPAETPVRCIVEVSARCGVCRTALVFPVPREGVLAESLRVSPDGTEVRLMAQVGVAPPSHHHLAFVVRGPEGETL